MHRLEPTIMTALEIQWCHVSPSSASMKYINFGFWTPGYCIGRIPLLVFAVSSYANSDSVLQVTTLTSFKARNIQYSQVGFNHPQIDIDVFNFDRRLYFVHITKWSLKAHNPNYPQAGFNHHQIHIDVFHSYGRLYFVQLTKSTFNARNPNYPQPCFNHQQIHIDVLHFDQKLYFVPIE
jgi:hypothetical protein